MDSGINAFFIRRALYCMARQQGENAERAEDEFSRTPNNLSDVPAQQNR
jgi:hypothetical protein